MSATAAKHGSEVERDADSDVIISQGAPRGQGGGCALAVGSHVLSRTVKETGSWTNYEDVLLGTVHLAAGVHDVSARPREIKDVALMNVKCLKLVPK